jgi:hypothetical protein
MMRLTELAQIDHEIIAEIPLDTFVDAVSSCVDIGELDSADMIIDTIAELVERIDDTDFIPAIELTLEILQRTVPKTSNSMELSWRRKCYRILANISTHGICNQ